MQFTPPPHKNAKIQLFGGNTELTACFAVLYVALRAIYYVFHPISVGQIYYTITILLPLVLLRMISFAFAYSCSTRISCSAP